MYLHIGWQNQSSYGVVEPGDIPSYFGACTNCTYWWSAFKTLLLLTTRPAACCLSLSLSPVYITPTCAMFYWSERCVYICLCVSVCECSFLYVHILFACFSLCVCALVSFRVFVSFCMFLSVHSLRICAWVFVGMCFSDCGAVCLIILPVSLRVFVCVFLRMCLWLCFSMCVCIFFCVCTLCVHLQWRIVRSPISSFSSSLPCWWDIQHSVCTSCILFHLRK